MQTLRLAFKVYQGNLRHKQTHNVFYSCLLPRMFVIKLSRINLYLYINHWVQICHAWKRGKSLIKIDFILTLVGLIWFELEQINRMQSHWKQNEMWIQLKHDGAAVYLAEFYRMLQVFNLTLSAVLVQGISISCRHDFTRLKSLVILWNCGIC